MTEEQKIPPAASRLQAITNALAKAHKEGVEAAEGSYDGIVLVEGTPVAIAIKRLRQLAQDMIDGSEDSPPVFPDGKPPKLAEIARECADMFGIPYDQICRKERRRGSGHLRDATRAYCYLARKLHGERKSYNQIASAIGLNDHTTVIHNQRVAIVAIETDRQFYVRVNAVERRLMANG